MTDVHYRSKGGKVRNIIMKKRTKKKEKERNCRQSPGVKVSLIVDRLRYPVVRRNRIRTRVFFSNVVKW